MPREFEPPLSAAVGADLDLDRVVVELKRLDPDGDRTGQVLRDTYDQLYDGARTQRYRWDQLMKTEKTHFGTLIEINLQREFEFVDGDKLDFKIAAREIDAKYSQTEGGWMLPPEGVGELCLLLTASDQTSRFSIGVVRALDVHLNKGMNRDGKRTLSSQGRSSIVWVHRDASLPPNTLLHMPESDVAAIFSAGKATSRIKELFRRTIGQIVSRSAVATVAAQLDITRRVRGGSGGARAPLAEEGIVVLGGAFDWQRSAARHLGLPEPRRTEYVAGYVAPAPPDWIGPSALGPTGLRLRPSTLADRRPFDPAWYARS
ncbi:restriction endonuclease [Dietzia cinnamea]|uniref:Restriction endonuclease n=1 Tax=Dietzia cinnamea TaxID=321318 RepID=A0AAW5QEI0_9ACTN|nr:MULTISPECIES: NaeI family type II restriction endonuclease [Dietzia]MCT1865827.1 restriction endonuclease [Dietzia cinnamea]MCT2031602.1 restriction endonuclease [Dietzia cinnamea]MCT2035222.1 restriction endonuclease [Dietzia cinnamea]MCT2077960.1 restriction endonuclease [Dietzia cinnamea]MCT2108063.1 restriction endonuclease [Dietzia cinnamea]